MLAATNGADALREMEAESPDLVALDVMMAAMDGLETLKRSAMSTHRRCL